MSLRFFCARKLLDSAAPRLVCSRYVSEVDSAGASRADHATAAHDCNADGDTAI